MQIMSLKSAFELTVQHSMMKTLSLMMKVQTLARFWIMYRLTSIGMDSAPLLRQTEEGTSQLLSLRGQLSMLRYSFPAQC